MTESRNKSCHYLWEDMATAHSKVESCGDDHCHTELAKWGNWCQPYEPVTDIHVVDPKPTIFDEPEVKEHNDKPKEVRAPREPT